LLAIILALLLTGKFNHGYKAMLDFVNTTIKKSISDISTLIVMLMFLAMFSAVAVKVTGRFNNVLTAIIPQDPWVLALTIGILSPLALFRGPLMVWGAGSATAAVLAATGFFNQVLCLCHDYHSVRFNGGLGMYHPVVEPMGGPRN